MASVGGKRILCVGLCCVDIISVVQSFPSEDTDQRSLDYYWQRGGNASNSSTVLSLLGGNVEFLGTLAKGQEYGFMERDFSSFNINIDNCPLYEEEDARCPVAVVIVNKQNGSRTIMAASDNTVELKHEDFEKVTLENYKWIHFEGRNKLECLKLMVDRVAAYNQKVQLEERVQISLELEKPKRKELLPLMEQVDYVFISKEFGVSNGYKNKQDVVSGMIQRCKPSGTVICAWGEDGAAAKSGSSDLVLSPIFPPKTLTDTLGAGDTFNAATILALSKGRSVLEAITYGCKVAGAKCGMVGYKDLKDLHITL